MVPKKWNLPYWSAKATEALEELLHLASESLIRLRDAIFPEMRLHLVTAACGMPKYMEEYEGQTGRYGDDAWFKTSVSRADIIGVADGVGAWREVGIDAGQFSACLMSVCKRLCQRLSFRPEMPLELLQRSYAELQQLKSHVAGSCTASILTLERHAGNIHVANIGDSGVMLIRNGKLVYKSIEQQYEFNHPHQLLLLPEETCPAQHEEYHNKDALASAELKCIPVQIGDVILVATDGVFDNIPEDVILEVLQQIEGCAHPTILQMTANTLAWMARALSVTENFLSPFALKAQRNAHWNIIGGKPDDVTVVISVVAF